MSEGRCRVPKGRDLIGLPVLAAQGLKRIGHVCELLLNQDATRICGLVLDHGGWLHTRRVLDYEAVQAVGPTHLVADERYLEDEAQTRCCQQLFGLPVLDRTADELGILDDFQFNTQNGRITALQLSRGFVDDLLNGKAVVEIGGGSVSAGESAILLDGPGELSGGALH